MVYNELKNRLLVDLDAELIEEKVPLDDGEALEEKFQQKEAENVKQIEEF